VADDEPDEPATQPPRSDGRSGRARPPANGGRVDPSGRGAEGSGRARRRTELVDATVALIRREGPLVSMDRIAAECGVTKPIIYRYFGDRYGLVNEVAGRLVGLMVAELLPLAARRPFREHMTATVDAYLRVIEDEPNLYRFLSHQTSVERRDLFARLVADGVALDLESRLRVAGRPTEAARPWAFALVGMVQSAGDWWVRGGRDDRPMSRAELAGHLMALVWDGLGPLDIDRPPVCLPDA
jgi:AcrR family transcriptional regulator